MQNDPRDQDGKKLIHALTLMGRDLGARQRVMALLAEFETEIKYDGAIREDITGPIADALHEDSDEYSFSLEDGTTVNYLYRTKIARDLLFAPQSGATHLWEPQTTKLLLLLSKLIAGDVIVGGAYFGDQAILVAKSISEKGRKVHCFEPNSAQAGMLQKNVALNALSNVEILKKGLWHTGSELMRLEGFDSFANAVVVSDGDGFETETIDDYADGGDLKVGMIQLDIEGSELAALQGASKTLQRDNPVVVFELHRSYVDWSNGLRNTEICNLFLELGYSVFAIRDINSHYEMSSHKVELVDIDRIYLEGPPHGFNMVAFPRGFSIDDSDFRIMENVSPKLLPHKDAAIHHPTEGFD